MSILETEPSRLDTSLGNAASVAKLDASLRELVSLARTQRDRQETQDELIETVSTVVNDMALAVTDAMGKAQVEIRSADATRLALALATNLGPAARAVESLESALELMDLGFEVGNDVMLVLTDLVSQWTRDGRLAVVRASLALAQEWAGQVTLDDVSRLRALTPDLVAALRETDPATIPTALRLGNQLIRHKGALMGLAALAYLVPVALLILLLART